MLDRLHPLVRHIVVLCVLAPVVAYIGVFALAVLTAGGVSTVDWGTTACTALDTAAVSVATGVTTIIALFATPLTRQYGVGEDLTSYEVE